MKNSWDIHAECLRVAQLVHPMTNTPMHIVVLFLWGYTLTSVQRVPEVIGNGYFDMTFIDHSDNFHECNRPLGNDIRNNEGAFMQSNRSLCEEKQFESQVLQPEWSWGGTKFIDLYMFNVTNPGAAAAGSKLNVQELAPILLSSGNTGGETAGAVIVNRDDLDTDGRLTYKVLRTWRYRKDLQTSQRTSSSEEVIVPHYIFAAALRNGMPVTDMTSAAARTSFTQLGLAEYYPLFVKVKISDLLGLTAYGAPDPVTEGASDVPFTLDMLEQNTSDASYFVSLRHGLQGFGFVRYAWNGQDVHCGYDRDCGQADTRVKPFQMSKEKALETSRNCVMSETCKPTSLKHSNNGVQYGVTAFKHLPSGSFMEIPQVTGELWDYKDYSKDGTTWTGLNMEHFFLYDVKLIKEARIMRIPTHEWSVSKFHRRTENCGGGGGDSPGFDCLGDESTIFIGSSRDSVRPGSLYFSQAQFEKLDGKENLEIATCRDQHTDILECSQPKKTSQTLTDSLFGYRVCHRQTSQVSIKLQRSTVFANTDPMVPLAWKKDHFCMAGDKMFELMRIYIVRTRVTPSLGYAILNLLILCVPIHNGIRMVFMAKRTDFSVHNGDKPCV